MKQMSKEDIKQYLLKFFKEEITDEELDKLNGYIEQLTIVLVDELYDLSKDKVEILDERQTFIIRKLFGILDNGTCQTYKKVGEILNLTRQRIAELKTRILNCLKYQIIFGNGLLVNNIKNQNQKLLLSDSIRNLNLSVNDLNYFQSIGINTIGDLISVNEIFLFEKINNEAKFNILKEKIANLGFSFNSVLQAKDLKVLPITVLNLSNRSLNALKRANIKTLNDLTRMTSKELSEVYFLGKTSLEEIKSSLYDFILLFSEESKKEMLKKDHHLSIDVLKLSDENKNALKKANIITINDLTNLTKFELFKIIDIEVTELKEIESSLNSFGLSFKKESFLEISKKLKKVPIELLDLSERSFNALQRANVTTINDLIGKTKFELSKIDGIGEKELEKIEICLQNFGLSFKVESFSKMPEDLKKLPIEVLNLSERSFNALKRANVMTIDDFSKMTKFELSKKNGIGVKILQEVEESLRNFGLLLKDDSYADEQQEELETNKYNKEKLLLERYKKLLIEKCQKQQEVEDLSIEIEELLKQLENNNLMRY